MKTETVYIKKLCSEELPKKDGCYDTDQGFVKYNTEFNYWANDEDLLDQDPIYWFCEVERIVMTEEELHDLVGFAMHTTVGFLNDPTKGEIFAENVYDLYLKSKEA